MEEGALAGAGGADYHERFALSHAQRDALEHSEIIEPMEAESGILVHGAMRHPLDDESQGNDGPAIQYVILQYRHLLHVVYIVYVMRQDSTKKNQ